MKTIHLLPTDKPSRLQRCALSEWFDISKANLIDDRWRYQNIYITNSEETKETELPCYVIYNETIQFIDNPNILKIVNAECSGKIILTTDQDLNKNGIQSIDDEFLHWFIKNAYIIRVLFDRCEFEEVYPLNCCIKKQGKTKANNGCMERNRCLNYKIIIPQEEPKQETLEEAANVFSNGFQLHLKTDNVRSLREGFVAGAKSDAARDYWFKIFQEQLKNHVETFLSNLEANRR